MKSAELRQKYLEFFKKHGHAIIPSASLIPENDPTVLFTTAGMHPLVPYLLGQKHPAGTKITDVQKCIRTGDIEDVGDDTHLTFFEMMGNWSLGEYWKKEAITWSFEFLTKELNIPLDRLAVTCFAGDEDAPKDDESAKIWENLGVKKERIAFLPKEDNWWGPAGQTGPCGPDTEMFYWKLNNEPAPEIFDAKNKNWVEIWNDVFMQYVKDENGNYNVAEQKNVDTGMGLERTLAVLTGKENVYETDLFKPLLDLIPEKAQLSEKQRRIIVDHLKASLFLISDGVLPSNKERGYVLRRLIRRVVAYQFLNKEFVSEKMLCDIIEKVGEIYGEFYNIDINFVLKQFLAEKQKFLETLEAGAKEYMKLIEIDSKQAFYLYQTFGLPFDIMKELNPEKTKSLSKEDFENELKKHQELSRTASAGTFKGGLADSSEQTTKLHTAAHLMLAGLRKFLGDSVQQKGSNITAERLRFDVSWKEKITPEILKQVEDFVNSAIQKDLPVVCKEMSLDQAKEINATGVFEHKYGERVKVYFVGENENNVSKEICGGPHVEHTGILGKFKITKEESSSAGVRRIKAILK